MKQPNCSLCIFFIIGLVVISPLYIQKPIEQIEPNSIYIIIYPKSYEDETMVLRKQQIKTIIENELTSLNFDIEVYPDAIHASDINGSNTIRLLISLIR